MGESAPSPQPVKSRAAREGFILLVALLAFVPAAKAVLYDTLDPDSFIHLLAANQLWREGIHPIVDHQSYMSVREPWTPYSWLAELGMKVIWDTGGFRAALATHAILAAGLIWLVGLACAARVRSQEDPDRLTRIGLATAFAAYLSIPYLSFRPVTLALVIMALCVWLLIRDRRLGERTRATWLVIPLTVLLVNVHLYAIILPAWLAALLVGALWEWWRAPHENRPEAKRRMWRYAILFGGSALGCLATPMLTGVMRSIAFYQSTDPMVAGTVVKEYLPFHAGMPGMVSAVLVILMLVFVLGRREELRAGEVFWLLGSLVLLLRMGRFSPVFAMAAAPMLAATLPRLKDAVLGRAITRLALMIVIGAGLYRVWQEVPGPSMTVDHWLERNGPMMPGYPARAARFVEEVVPRRTGRVINEYSWGGYLSWRLGPKFQVLLDGRTNLYPPDFWQRTYLSAKSNDVAAFLTSLDADVAVLPTGASRFQPLLEAAGWKVALADPRATVLVPPGAPIDIGEWNSRNGGRSSHRP
jgi:hypothetical protein